jgi:hypothetical protein
VTTGIETARARPAKAVAVVLALVPAAGAVVLGLWSWAVWNFPWENQEPRTTSDRVGFGFLLAATVIVFLPEAGVVVSVARDRARTATFAFCAQAAVALGLLIWGLETSEHSDGKLVAIAVACELPGLIAVLMSRRGTACVVSRMARAGIEPATPRFSAVCSTD